jgi:hypothetical protein
MNDEQLAADIRRVFGRYHMEPLPVEGSTDPTPAVEQARPPFLARRRVLGGLSLAGAGVAVAVALSLSLGVLPGGQPESAYAGWQPIPTQPDAAMRALADSMCRRFMDLNNATYGGQLPLVAQDQRGRAALFMFSRDNKYLACLIRPNDYGSYDAIGYGAARDLQPLDGHFELVAKAGSLTVASPGPDDVVVVFGRTDASKLVIQRTDGVDVTATISGDVFVAWWPGNSNSTTFVAYDNGGRVIERADPWATPCICQIEPQSPNSGD